MMLLLTAKNVSIFFGLATVALGVSTIVLCIEKSSLAEKLQDALGKLDVISSLTTSRPATSSPNSTKTPEITSEVALTTSHSNSTELPESTITVSNGPTFPTLPPGLPDPDKIIYRLPKDIRPIKYKLYIYPDLTSKTCEGSVSIQIEIDVATNLIVLHAKNLEIKTSANFSFTNI